MLDVYGDDDDDDDRTLNVSDRFTVHHQDSSTVNTAIDTCHTEISVFSLVFIIIIPQSLFSEKGIIVIMDLQIMTLRKRS
jgi:hypothetical protein